MLSCSRRFGPLVLAALIAAAPTARAQSAAGSTAVFTVAKYPVEAQAQNAVAAKEKAIADGQQAAFRSLLKRLVPVTAYKSLGPLRNAPAEKLVDGLAVRAERNSTTSYTATLDFTYDAKAVRDLLRRSGVPFLDVQAPETVLVPVVIAAAPGAGDGQLGRLWREAWSGLDLEHAIAPMKLHAQPAALTPDLIRASLADPNASLRAIAPLARSGQAMLAIAEPDPAARKVHITLSGTDAVGSFVLRRSYRLDPADDFAYTAELAAVVALGVVEGRWKSMRAPAGAVRPSADTPLQPVQLIVEFRSLQEWQSIRRMLDETPGIESVVIGGLSSRSADVALRYPGGGQALASALAPQGVELRSLGGAWVVRSGN